MEYIKLYRVGKENCESNFIYHVDGDLLDILPLQVLKEKSELIKFNSSSYNGIADRELLLENMKKFIVSQVLNESNKVDINYSGGDLYHNSKLVFPCDCSLCENQESFTYSILENNERERDDGEMLRDSLVVAFTILLMDHGKKMKLFSLHHSQVQQPQNKRSRDSILNKNKEQFIHSAILEQFLSSHKVLLNIKRIASDINFKGKVTGILFKYTGSSFENGRNVFNKTGYYKLHPSKQNINFFNINSNSIINNKNNSNNNVINDKNNSSSSISNSKNKNNENMINFKNNDDNIDDNSFNKNNKNENYNKTSGSRINIIKTISNINRNSFSSKCNDNSQSNNYSLNKSSFLNNCNFSNQNNNNSIVSNCLLKENNSNNSQFSNNISDDEPPNKKLNSKKSNIIIHKLSSKDNFGNIHNHNNNIINNDNNNNNNSNSNNNNNKNDFEKEYLGTPISLFRNILNNYDFGIIMKRFLEKWRSLSHLSLGIIEEYIKFTILKIIDNDTTGYKIMASPLIQEFWETHIMNTIEYEYFCTIILGLKGIIQNYPESKDESICKKRIRYIRTLKLYWENFGKYSNLPSENNPFWPSNYLV